MNIKRNLIAIIGLCMLGEGMFAAESKKVSINPLKYEIVENTEFWTSPYQLGRKMWYELLTDLDPNIFNGEKIEYKTHPFWKEKIETSYPANWNQIFVNNLENWIATEFNEKLKEWLKEEQNAIKLLEKVGKDITKMYKTTNIPFTIYYDFNPEKNCKPKTNQQKLLVVEEEKGVKKWVVYAPMLVYYYFIAKSKEEGYLDLILTEEINRSIWPENPQKVKITPAPKKINPKHGEIKVFYATEDGISYEIDKDGCIEIDGRKFKVQADGTLKEVN